MSERFVVVGGDAAGLSAAAKARRVDPDREVVVLERSSWVSYGACGILLREGRRPGPVDEV